MSRGFLFVLAMLLLFVSRPVALSADPKAPVSHDVSIEDLQFDPADLVIAPGETVVWTNHGDGDYDVVAKDGSFDSKTIRRGQTFSYTFKKPGKYPYRSRLHPRMKGTVIVKAGEGESRR